MVSVPISVPRVVVIQVARPTLARPSAQQDDNEPQGAPVSKIELIMESSRTWFRSVLAR